jgi:hypothetical protein
MIIFSRFVLIGNLPATALINNSLLVNQYGSTPFCLKTSRRSQRLVNLNRNRTEIGTEHFAMLKVEPIESVSEKEKETKKFKHKTVIVSSLILFMLLNTFWH